MINKQEVLSYLPLGFFIGLLAFDFVLFYYANAGLIEYVVVSTFTTIVLVFTTIFYAWQLRKSADYTEASLVEMRKDRDKHGQTMVISFGIDPILESLRTSHREFVDIQENLDRKELPQVNILNMPDEIVIEDIEEHVSGFNDKLEALVDKTHAYNSNRKSLLEGIAKYSRDKHVTLQDTTIADLHNISLQIEMFVESLIFQTGREPHSEYVTSEEWQEIRDDLTPVQEHSEFGPRLEEVVCHLDGGRELVSEIINDLEMARYEIRSKYGITELEIEEVKQESELTEQNLVKKRMNIQV